MPHYTPSQAAAQQQASQAATQIAKAGVVSQHVASILSQNDRTVACAQRKPGLEDHRMSCFIIDASGSMKDCRDAVIQEQQKTITTLRNSSKCRRNALFIGQWLFSDTSTKLNPYTPLSTGGGDGVVLLDQSRYNPNGGTALYKTVFQVLQEIAANIAYSLSKAFSTTFTIAVVTDGDDTEGGADPNDIKAIVQELKTNGYLVSSIVIGIENPRLSRSKIEEIRDRLGFDTATFAGQSDSEIRRAFDAASQSALV
jgi:Mg-chelatase subunit ChlD